MHRDIDEILIDRSAIATRITEVAQQLTADLITQNNPIQAPNSRRSLILVPVLTGSFIFLADLIRHLPLHLRIQMLWVTSYPGKSTTTQGPTLRNGLAELPDDLSDSDVIIIDDILDSGQTIQLTTQIIAERNPRSLKTCVLLRKQRDTAMHIPADYVCFDIPDQFVVGYGLDYDGYYRNLPDLVTLRSEVLQA